MIWHWLWHAVVTVWLTFFGFAAAWVVINGLAMDDELDAAERDLSDRLAVGRCEWIP